MMNYREQAVIFDCKGERLVGIVSLPNSITKPATRTGVIIIVGGPQYRAGSHRQFVLLARGLAAAGTPVLRFDYRGMGDSTGKLHTFDNVNEDVGQAINALCAAAPQVIDVALWGLCDGASAALLYCHATKDDRVKSLCLLNPWVRSEASLAKTHLKHYYTQRLRQKEFWRKLLSGKVAVSAVSGLICNLAAAFSAGAPGGTDAVDQSFQTRMALAWMQFNGMILLLLSGNDYASKEFLEYVAQNSTWRGVLGKTGVFRHDLEHADHTFSDSGERKQMESLCTVWLINNHTSSANLGDNK